MKQLRAIKYILLLIGAGIGILAVPEIASATPITTGSNFTVNWSTAISGMTGAATASFSNFSFSSNQVQFTLDVTNTSTGTSAGNDIRFTAFGWTTNPATSAATDDSSVYASLVNTNLSSVNVSVCLYSGPNCNGGSNGGLEDPNNTGLHGDPTTTGNFQVTLTFISAVPPLDFSNFYGKFQTAVGSYEVDGSVVLVPEPASVLLFASGLLGLGLVLRRSRLKA